MPKVVLSGGGTGGHLTPILTIARALKASHPQLELHLFTETGGVGQSLLDKADLPVQQVLAGKWRRYYGQTTLQRLTDLKTVALNLRDLFRLVLGLAQALWQLGRLRPQVVFVKGGYVGLPVGLAAWLLGIPLIIHESDVVAGLTNRLLSHLARTIATGWPAEYYPGWQHKSLVFTGNIVDLRYAQAVNQDAKAFFRLPAAKPVLLITGGSLGARVLNQFVVKHLEQLLEQFEIIHLTGQSDYRRLLKQLPNTPAVKVGYRAYEFLGAELAAAYDLANIVITRAGATTLAELALIGKPLIIVPYRYSVSNHQVHNAKVLDDLGAAVMVTEGPQMDTKLIQALAELYTQAPKRQQLVKQLQTLAKPQAAANLAKAIARLI